MQIVTVIATVVLLAICATLLFLKFIRTTVLNCLAIKRVKWGTMRVKLLDCKIAVEISALTIQLVLLSEKVIPVATRKAVKSPNRLSNSNSRASQLKSLLIAVAKASVSYLFSCFTIVLSSCLFELETSEGERVEVRRKPVAVRCLMFTVKKLNCHHRIIAVYLVHVFLSDCLIIHVCIYLFIYMWMSIYLLACLLVCPFIFIYVCISICLTVYLSSICLSICPLFFVPAYLSACLFFYPHIY